MSQALLTVVTHTAPGDGHLVPRWTGGNGVALEPSDGWTDELPVRRLVTGTLGTTISTDTTLDGVSARVLITDSRVAIVCRRFQAKGGGWVGFGAGAVRLPQHAASRSNPLRRGGPGGRATASERSS